MHIRAHVSNSNDSSSISSSSSSGEVSLFDAAIATGDLPLRTVGKSAGSSSPFRSVTCNNIAGKCSSSIVATTRPQQKPRYNNATNAGIAYY
jgi:hypothetical protein